MNKRVVGVMAIATMAVVGGCGDDGSSAAGDINAFCRLSDEADSRAPLPSAETMADFIDSAPGEVRDDVEVFVDAFTSVENPEDLEALFAALEEPDVVESTERVQSFEARNCD